MAMFRKAVIAASLIWVVPAFAQSAQDHDAHHPDTVVPQVTQPAGTASPGMTGGNMMGPPGQSGAGGMMPMMNMMTGARSGAEHIEGRLAFVKAELKITEAQTALWNAFTEATRSNASSMSEMRKTMMSRPGAALTLPERLAIEDKAMTAHLTALKKTEEAVAKLYGVLTDDQKKIADGIILGPMGMPMGMM